MAPMLERKEIIGVIMHIMREHQCIPQQDYNLPDGSIAILCKCSVLNEYNSNGYTDHLTLAVIHAIEDKIQENDLD
jgi:hypothetical protein